MKNTFDTIVVTATICCGLRCARREAKSLEVIRVSHPCVSLSPCPCEEGPLILHCVQVGEPQPREIKTLAHGVEP